MHGTQKSIGKHRVKMGCLLKSHCFFTGRLLAPCSLWRGASWVATRGQPVAPHSADCLREQSPLCSKPVSPSFMHTWSEILRVFCIFKTRGASVSYAPDELFACLSNTGTAFCQGGWAHSRHAAERTSRCTFQFCPRVTVTLFSLSCAAVIITRESCFWIC